MLALHQAPDEGRHHAQKFKRTTRFYGESLTCDVQCDWATRNVMMRF